MMKKNKTNISRSTLALFAVAVGLLLFSTVTGARAALQIFSLNYRSTLEMHHVGITLNEYVDGVAQPVSYRDYVAGSAWSVDDENGLLSRFKDEDLILGKEYDEDLTVTNSSNEDGEGINEFVRVTVRKYWVNREGVKTTELSPDLIKLGFVTGDWVIDDSATTDERTVLYYTKLLNIGEESTKFMDWVKISSDIPLKATQTVTPIGERKSVITTTYDYDGYSFVLEVEADGIQEHHADDAILSAWGRQVEISGTTLSLK